MASNCIASYTYTRPAERTDLTYEVEVSSDLVSWSTVGVTHGFVTSAGDMETWRGVVPLSAGTKVFFRLKITR
ncbi:MAG: hypothetical protein PSV13_12175 [Lacunisphaera sp.]|nr:hypothetical protein [Lacunisphaera sp.]